MTTRWTPYWPFWSCCPHPCPPEAAAFSQHVDASVCQKEPLAEATALYPDADTDTCCSIHCPHLPYAVYKSLVVHPRQPFPLPGHQQCESDPGPSDFLLTIQLFSWTKSLSFSKTYSSAFEPNTSHVLHQLFHLGNIRFDSLHWVVVSRFLCFRK